MPFYTPLRYPGGKRKLGNFLKALLEENGLVGSCYVEPYAGGAGLALSLLFENYVSKILINDLNVSIFSFWNSVLNHTEGLCRLIKDTPITMEQWHYQKDIQAHSEELSGSLDLGFSTFFLNRTNRSGIIKGGVLGGKEQKSKWKLSERFAKKNLIERIESIAAIKDKILISNTDALDFVKKNNDKMNPSSCLIYMDPPYYKKGAELYDNFYKPEDHIELSIHINKIMIPWIISYDDVTEVRQLYKDYRAINYSLNYTAQSKTEGLEFMAFSKSLSLPKKIYNGPTSFGCMRQITLA